MSAIARSQGEGETRDGLLFSELRDALLHLHDLVRLETHPLAKRLGLSQQSRRDNSSIGKALRQRLVDLVESVRPANETPAESHAWRSYHLLRLRYLEALDASEVQHELSIGKSEYHRDLRKAIAALVSLLEAGSGPADGVKPPEADGCAQGGRRADLAPADTTLPQPSRGNLPISPSSFVGRERETAEVEALLMRGRLVSLTGAGGSGKTRLALEVAAEVSAAYPDGVWLVEFGALEDSTLVPQTVAAALGLVEERGSQIVSTLIDYLRARRMMLVLDNCEHLIEPCAKLVDALLRACPDLTVLATSRECLRTDGEAVYLVPPLGVPEPEALPNLDGLLHYGSVQLFVERAAGSVSGFAVSARNAPAVAKICSRLDGLPLAIELAAARVRALTPEQIASRLDDRFRLLTDGSRAALPRQQTLAATLDWSYDLLSTTEKALLGRLAVFAGGFTLDAVEGICADEPTSAVTREGKRAPTGSSASPIDTLARLVEKSLVLAEPRGAEARYRLLETIREYAWHRLKEAGEEDVLRDRHLGWYSALAEEGRLGLDGPNQRDWIDRFHLELGNFRAAIDWSRARENVESEIRLAIALAPTWSHAEFDIGAHDRLPELIPRGANLGGRARLLALVGAGEAACEQGRLQEAKSLYREALRLAREEGERKQEVRSLTRLGWAQLDFGELAEAQASFEEALALARLEGFGRDSAQLLSELSELRSRAGDHANARRLSEESVAIARSLGDLMFVRAMLVDLSQQAIFERDFGRAREAVEEALAIERDLGIRQPIYRGLCYLGDVARAEGDYLTSESLYREAADSAFRAREYTRAAMGLGRLADLRVEQGLSRSAARLFGALDAWYASVGMPVAYKPHPEHDRDVDAARVSLGEEAFARAFAEGQAMTLDQAVEYALSADAGGSASHSPVGKRAP